MIVFRLIISILCIYICYQICDSIQLIKCPKMTHAELLLSVPNYFVF